MAITNAIPELWSAALLIEFEKMSVMQPLTTNLSSELPGRRPPSHSHG